MYSDPRIKNNEEDLKREQQRKEAEERMKKQQKEEEERKKRDRERELKRKIQSLNLDLNTVESKLGVAKASLKVYDRDARMEASHSEKAERELTLMRRELAQKKGAVRKLEKDIENKIAHEKRGSGEDKRRIFEDKKRALEKLENERSSLLHRMARTEAELRNLR